VLLLGSAMAHSSRGKTATNRAVGSEGSVRVDLARSALDTLASNGATDDGEPDRSQVGSAVLLITTPTPTLTSSSALTPLPAVTPTVEPVAPLESPTPEVSSETGDVSVTVIGDSIALATATNLKALVPDLDFFAQVGLQVSGGIAALQDRADAGSLGETVVIDLGNNGAFTPSQFDTVMTLVGAERRVFFVNVNVPRAWRDTNNQLLEEKVAQYSNASVLDWYGTSLGHPEYFAEDGVHLGTEGAQALTNLLLGALS
jgi:hypothetical protein